MGDILCPPTYHLGGHWFVVIKALFLVWIAARDGDSDIGMCDASESPHIDAVPMIYDILNQEFHILH